MSYLTSLPYLPALPTLPTFLSYPTLPIPTYLPTIPIYPPYLQYLYLPTLPTYLPIPYLLTYLQYTCIYNTYLLPTYYLWLRKFSSNFLEHHVCLRIRTFFFTTTTLEVISFSYFIIKYTVYISHNMYKINILLYLLDQMLVLGLNRTQARILVSNLCTYDNLTIYLFHILLPFTWLCQGYFQAL